MNGSVGTVKTNAPRVTGVQTATLVTLRVLIGWHFLNEGIAKITSPHWSSSSYLADSKWLLGDFFIAIGSDTTAVTIIDYANMWGLTLIGLGLMLGLFVRTASIAGITLLALYWIAAPPLAGYAYTMPSEGSYLIVNKVLIELAALLVVLAIPTSRTFGFDRFVARRARA
jgi:thiosulfate dehydrogenase [quinone] large subunit